MPRRASSSWWVPCSRSLSLVQHQDAVGVLDGRQAVGDDEAGAADEQAVERPLDELLGLGVDRRGGLVEDQDAGIEGEGAGEGDELLLAHREAGAALAHRGVEAPRQARDEVQGLHLGRRPAQPRRRRSPRSPRRMLSPTVPEKRKTSWSTMPTLRRSARQVPLAHVHAVDPHRAARRRRRSAAAGWRGCSCRRRCGRPRPASRPAATRKRRSSSTGSPGL